jgi:hypothetical protein
METTRTITKKHIAVLLFICAALQLSLQKINIPFKNVDEFLFSSKTIAPKTLNSSASLNVDAKTLGVKDLKDNKSINQSNASNEIVVTFVEAPSIFNITKAPLKYNKDFAYSLTLDDGKDNAITAAYPLLAGGFSSETGQSYPGLFYTDGCGNKIEFKAGIAVGSVNPSGDDTHLGTPGVLTWDQVKELYSKNWDVFNHGYTHASGPGTNYDYEVKTNATYIKSKTGIDLTHFVIPSGDANYTDYAFNAGMKAVYNQGSEFPGSDGLLVNSPITLTKFKLYRQFLNDDNYSTITGKVDQIAAKSNSTNHYWYTEFTHHVSVAKQGGSLLFPTFKSHMEKLQSNFGYSGSDRMWMAPMQEVYEYLSVRESVGTTSTINNNKGIITLNYSQTPTDLRRYCISFIVDSDKDFSDVDCPGASKITFKGSGNKKLINIEWPQNPLTITGILDPFKTDYSIITAYPNPVENQLTLSLPELNMQEVEISIFNDYGSEVYTGSQLVMNEKSVLDLSNSIFKKGLYVIKIKSKTGHSKVGKFLKN